jgi:hypothetical protein
MKEVEIPDFEDMYKNLEEIRKKSLSSKLLEKEIEADESYVTKEATSNTEYHVNGKPPSQAHINKSWLVTGFDGELLKKREQLAELESELEYLRMRYELDKIVIDVWRTQSANKRKAVDI